MMCAGAIGVHRFNAEDSSLLSLSNEFGELRSGHFNISVTEVHARQRKFALFVAVELSSRFVFVELHERIASRTAAERSPRQLREGIECPIENQSQPQRVAGTDRSRNTRRQSKISTQVLQ